MTTNKGARQWWGAAPRVADSAHQRRHTTDQIHIPNFRARKFLDAAFRPGKRSAQRRHGAEASGIDARRGETPQAARCAARKPGPVGETPYLLS